VERRKWIKKICKKETENVRSEVCFEELSLVISCRQAEKLSYLVRMLKGSDDDYDDRKKQKAETGRDKKVQKNNDRERSGGMKK